MVAPLSLTSTMRLAPQTAKGTPATSKYICARLMESSLQSVYEYIDAQLEHYCGASNSPTTRKSPSRVSGLLVPFGGVGLLYPDFVGNILLGLGFGTTGGTAGTNEVQTVTITGEPTGGDFTLTYSGQTTAAIAFDATAATVQTRLRALSTIGGSNVNVTGNAGGPYTVTFVGALGNTNVAQISATATGLTGGTTPGVTTATTTPGAAASGTGSNAFTIVDRSDAKYMTALHSYGDGAELYTLRAADARIEQWSLEAGPQGIQSTFAGVGLAEAPAAGGEVGTTETDAMLLPSKGSATITVEGESFTSALRGLNFVISNPVDRREMQLFSLERTDIPQTGIDVGGSLMGIDMTYENYRLLKWASKTAVGPTMQAIKGDVEFKFESTEEYSTGVPYSMEITIPNVEFRLGEYRARGRDLVRANLAFMMYDAATPPITVTLVNGVVY